jgi:hypothetical protein
MVNSCASGGWFVPLTLAVSHRMRGLSLSFLLLTCFAAPAVGSSTNQSEATLFISSIRGEQPIVRVERNDFPSEPDLCHFSPQMVRQWQTNYGLCSEALVAAAQKDRLDSSSLAKILRTIRTAPENNGLAVLPVAAYSTTKDGERVWLISLRWERERSAIDWGTLSHIRNFTFTQKSLKQVGFMTCK